jgi:hypothetical protein
MLERKKEIREEREERKKKGKKERRNDSQIFNLKEVFLIDTSQYKINFVFSLPLRSLKCGHY